MSDIGGIISGVGNIVAGNQAAKAAKKAAALQAQQYQETKQSLQPYMTAGNNAINTYGTMVGLNGIDAQKEYFNNFQNDPGFKASEDYATRGINNLNAINGRQPMGGNVIAGLGDYLQKNMLNAYQSRASQIGGLVDTGRSAATSLGGIGQQSAATQGQLLSNAGYYQGAGIANAGNAINQGLYNQQAMNTYRQSAGLPGASNFLGLV